MRHDPKSDSYPVFVSFTTLLSLLIANYPFIGMHSGAHLSLVASASPSLSLSFSLLLSSFRRDMIH